MTVRSLAACAMVAVVGSCACAQDTASSPRSESAPAQSHTRDPAMGVQEGDPRLDEATGRLVATWARDRWFDYSHIRVEVDIPDVHVALLTGVVAIDATPIGTPLLDMELDCDGPIVTAADVNGSPATFRMYDKKVLVVFPAAINTGQAVRVTLKYTLDFSEAQGEGLTLCPPNEEADNPTAAAPMIHAQGEAELNSRWFPCLDSPTYRMTSEVITTVDDGYEVVSNGSLLSKTPAGPGSLGQARTRWHWSQTKPHALYLITLGIGKWSVIDLGGPESARPGLPMPAYVMEGQEDRAREAMQNTAAMIAFFEKKFDEPYPWDKYAQVLVRCFAAGGMENTSATFLSAGAFRGEGTRDSLVSHELAHQWFGDLMTCRSWDHLWLNEGWATYCETLWEEEKVRAADGDEAARAAYLRRIERSIRGLARRSVSAPEHPAVVSNRFENPDAVFSKRDNPYGKGAFLLHMLREKLGDEVFFRAVAAYIDKYKFTQVTTDDFRTTLESVSGKSLEQFFEQWAYRPGACRLDVTSSLSDGRLTLTAAQTQRIDRHNPAYAFEMPVRITMSDGSVVMQSMMVDEKTQTKSFAIAGSPVRVDMDPTCTALAMISPRAFNPVTGEAITQPNAEPERLRRRPAGDAAQPASATQPAKGDEPRIVPAAPAQSAAPLDPAALLDTPATPPTQAPAQPPAQTLTQPPAQPK